MKNIKGVRKIDFLKMETIKSEFRDKADEKRKEYGTRIDELNLKYSDVLEKYKNASEEFNKVKDEFNKAVNKFNDTWQPLIGDHKKEMDKIKKQYKLEVKNLQKQLESKLEELYQE